MRVRFCSTFERSWASVYYHVNNNKEKKIKKNKLLE